MVCLGCAHSGIVNTLDYVAKVNAGAKLRAVIGGLHLMNANEERLQRTAEALLAAKVPLVVASHCTGAAALRFLADALGERLQPCAAGMVFEF